MQATTLDLEHHCPCRPLNYLMGKNGYVYIMSNEYRDVIYIGVTSNLQDRSHEHKTGIGSVFTTKYKCTDLIYFECFDDIRPAIDREKELKRYKRAWKFQLIKSQNPKMRDLYDDVEGYT